MYLCITYASATLLAIGVAVAAPLEEAHQCLEGRPRVDEVRWLERLVVVPGQQALTVPEIARAFLVQRTTMEQRITRAKAKIKTARIPYRVPSTEDLPARVSGVLAVLHLVFNEGYLSTGPDTDPVRHDLTGEAIRLARLIRAHLPEDGEVTGLLALMLLTEARRTARVSANGELITLVE